MSTDNIAYLSFLTEREVARILNVSVATVRRARLLGTGVRFRKVGACVRYDLRDVQAYVDSLPTGGGNARTA